MKVSDEKKDKSFNRNQDLILEKLRSMDDKLGNLHEDIKEANAGIERLEKVVLIGNGTPSLVQRVTSNEVKLQIVADNTIDRRENKKMKMGLWVALITGVAGIVTALISLV